MYKVMWKNPIFADENYNKVLQTQVQIQKNDPLVTITQKVNGNIFDKTDDQIIHLVLEQFYQETYLNRAEKEQITEIKEAIEEARKAAKDAQESAEKNTEKINKAIADMTTLVTTMVGGEEVDEEIEEGGEENVD